MCEVFLTLKQIVNDRDVLTFISQKGEEAQLREVTLQRIVL